MMILHRCLWLALGVAVSRAATIAEESVGTQPILLGKQLAENPYSVTVMQQAATAVLTPPSTEGSLTPEDVPIAEFDGHHRKLAVTQIVPTHKYVKITPRSDGDLAALLALDDSDDNDIVLHDHPIDFEVEQDGDYFVQPKDENDIYHPVYTVVPISYRFPSSLLVEVLEQIVEPTDDEAGDAIEEVALQSVGLDLDAPDARLLPSHRKLFWGSKYTPRGCIKVYNTNTNTYDPLRQAKVSIGRLVWWHYVHTDNNGCFVANKRYRGTVYVRMKWRSNVATIRKSWNELLGVFVSDRLMTVKSNTNNRTYNIPLSDNRLWYKGTVHNGIVKYNDCAISEGIHKRVAGANVWVWENGSSHSGAAPMLHKYKNLPAMASIAGFTQSKVWEALVNSYLSMLIALVPANLRPDLIFCGLKNAKETWRIEQLVFHECGHFSHASNAGSWFWSKLVAAEVTNIVFNGGQYSDGTEPSIAAGEQISLVEGWATLTEYRCMKKINNRAYVGYFTTNVSGFLDQFIMNRVPATRPNRGSDGWFLHGLMWDVLDSTETSSSRYVQGNSAATLIGPIDDAVALSDSREFFPIFRYLDNTVWDACDLGQELVGGYSSKGPEIADLFASYGFSCVNGAPTPPSPTPIIVDPEGCFFKGSQFLCP